MAFGAEEARLTGRTIALDEFERQCARAR